MQELRVIGVENGGLLVAGEDGTRFRIPIDEVLQSKLRQSVPDQGTGPKLTPREIQTHIRAGMSAEDVAAITGGSLEYIQRFEGPVLAEREFVVNSALAVPVRIAGDDDPLSEGKTFGIAIRERLGALGALGERWSSWKDAETGWTVRLTFTANQIDHEALWQYDPKKQSLVPSGGEAVALSQQSEPTPTLIPRLRAVATEAPTEASRFDSGAFAFEEPTFDEGEDTGPAPLARIRSEEPPDINHTADLLEALRRRRGERETASFAEEDARAQHPSTGSIRVVENPLAGMEGSDLDEEPQRATAPQPRAQRKGRTAMPSWDEIVFGARSDDDPA